ncbi:MAG: ammonium transporter [Planctomycetota bacterium]|jgi:Amt family ammonium transporter
MYSRLRKFNVGKIAVLLLLFVVMEEAAVDPLTAAIDAAKEEMQTNINIVWTCVAAFLVFFMQAGFAMVEAGFTRAKNAVNILMKNLMDFSIGTLAFFFIGFSLMFGASKGFFGWDGFGLSGVEGDGSHWNWTFLIFQTVFAGTAATIVSGAMAGRTQFKAYICYSVFICAFIYPIFGSWAWGSLLNGVPGHNITLAALGVFILWFGWFGFNPGSTTVGDGEIGRVAVTTNLAAAAGAIVAMIVSWVIGKKPDASMSLNGALAGLVGITAGCYTVTPMGAVVIGAIAGALVYFSVIFIDSVLKIDDPVGAVSVHGVCGAFGTLACGLFNAEAVLGIGDANGGLFYGGGFAQLGTQLAGIGAAFAWAFGLGLVMFTIIKVTVGLRASKEEEIKGLDIGEHGMEAYAGFQIFSSM